MSNWTKKDQIIERLREGYDVNHFNRLYRLQKFAFGENIAEVDSGILSSGMIFDFPDILPDQLEIGKSRRILNHTFITASKILYSFPTPEFNGIPEDVASVRKQFWKKRFTENGVDGDWSNEVASAFLDGDSLGLGVVQIGLCDTKAGNQKVTIQHIPATRFIWDAHPRTPSKARWIAFIHYISYDEAVARFGEKVATDNLRNEVYNEVATVKSVRLVEYYDIGFATGEPTRALFMDSWDGECVEYGPNPFGELLPFAFYQFFTPPGCRKPIGRIFMQMASQEALNEVEENLRLTVMRGAGFDLVDSSQLDESDLESLNAGEPSIKVKYNPGQGAPYIRIPASEVAQSMLQYQSYLERQLSTESGLTDLDRGNLYSSQRTATEINNLATQSAIQGSWSKKQLVAFYQRIIDVVFKIAMQFDREPLMIDINGVDYELNNPNDPHSWIEWWLQDAAEIDINESTLEFQDDQQKRNQQLQALNLLTAEVQAGLIDPKWWIEQKLRILGYNPDQALAEKLKAPPAPEVPQQAPSGIDQGQPQLTPEMLQQMLAQTQPQS